MTLLQRYVWLIVGCFFTTSLYAADTETNHQSQGVEGPCVLHSTASDCQGKPTPRFNIDRFNANQRNGYWSYKINGITTEQRQDDLRYTEYLSNSRNSGKLVREYNSQGILTSEGYRFAGNIEGVWKDYNAQGDLIRTKDYDILPNGYPPDPSKPLREDYDIAQGRFDFSLAQLASKMEKEFGVQLNDSAVSLSKIQVPEPYYIVYLQNSVFGFKHYYGYLVDGKTGELVYQAPLIRTPSINKYRTIVRGSDWYQQYYQEKYGRQVNRVDAMFSPYASQPEKQELKKPMTAQQRENERRNRIYELLAAD